MASSSSGKSVREILATLVLSDTALCLAAFVLLATAIGLSAALLHTLGLA